MDIPQVLRRVTFHFATYIYNRRESYTHSGIYPTCVRYPTFFFLSPKQGRAQNKSHKVVLYCKKKEQKNTSFLLLTRENHVETNSRRNNRGGGTSSCRSCVCVCVYACACVFLSFRIYILLYFNNSLTQKERQVIVPVRSACTCKNGAGPRVATAHCGRPKPQPAVLAWYIVVQSPIWYIELYGLIYNCKSGID